MPDRFDTTQVRDESAHWDALAERMAATAVRESRRSGFDWLTNSRAAWVTVSLLAAAVLAFVMRPAAGPPTGNSGEWAQALAPADDVGSAIVFRESPPAIGALLLAGRGGGGR
jgi:hypothetical protein